MRNQEDRSSPTTQYAPNSLADDPNSPEAQKPPISATGVMSRQTRQIDDFCPISRPRPNAIQGCYLRVGGHPGTGTISLHTFNTFHPSLPSLRRYGT